MKKFQDIKRWLLIITASTVIAVLFVLDQTFGAEAGEYLAKLTLAFFAG